MENNKEVNTKKQCDIHVVIDTLICPCCKSKKIYTVPLDGYKVCVDCDTDWAY